MTPATEFAFCEMTSLGGTEVHSGVGTRDVETTRVKCSNLPAANGGRESTAMARGGDTEMPHELATTQRKEAPLSAAEQVQARTESSAAGTGTPFRSHANWSGEIEVAPIAFMRGRTLADAFVILDEAQNTTPAQMKMFLTRFGQNSRMVVCGDPKQVDIPGGDAMSGLADAVRRLEDVDGIAVVRFGVADVVRHPIVGRIVEAYEGKDA